MIPRTLLSVLPRQSPSSAILLSMSLEAFVALFAIWIPYAAFIDGSLESAVGDEDVDDVAQDDRLRQTGRELANAFEESAPRLLVEACHVAPRGDDLEQAVVGDVLLERPRAVFDVREQRRCLHRVVGPGPVAGRAGLVRLQELVDPALELVREIGRASCRERV